MTGRERAARLLATVRDPFRRRIAYALGALVLAILCVVPQQYFATAKMVPDDNSGNSFVSVFSALGGRQQNFASLFGDRGTIEVALSIARSQSITDDVIRNLKLAGPGARYASLRQAQLALAKKVNVQSLTGGMLQVEVHAGSSDWALQLNKAFVAAISRRIGDYSQQQIVRRRHILDRRLADAAARLSQSEAALGAFKRENRLADPQIQLGSKLALRTNLEAQLQAKIVELESTRQTAGAENPAVRTLEAAAATLRAQIAQSATDAGGPTGPSVTGLTNISMQYADLYRSYVFAQSIYDVYVRSMEEVAVQELVAQNARDVAIIDPPHVDPQRHFNAGIVALLGLWILLAAFTELYAPATGLLDAKWTKAEE